MTTNIKLTPAQKAVVKAMREGAKIIRTGFIDEIYTFSGTSRNVQYEIVDELEDMRIISEYNATYHLTPLGRTIPLD